MLEIHPDSIVSPLADIEDSSRGSVIAIGARSSIDSFVKFKAAGGSGDIRIGADVTINSGCVLYIGNGISIGDGSLIAANCTFAPTNHEFRDGGKPILSQGFMKSRGGILLEGDNWIGANVVLLDGAVIGRGAVIGAGSVVKERVPPYSVYAGNPLRKVGQRS